MSQERADAKLTLHLYVTGIRADGYHLLDSEMVSVSLSDTLTFGEGDGVTASGVNTRVPLDASNTVSKALRLAGKSAAVHIDKQIPIGGGLGGGSSDAAAAFRWAGLIDDELAATVGADVPFCLRGGRAHVKGIGEQLTALPYEERTFTLITPPVHVSTPAVFKTFDAQGITYGEETRNHLEAAALSVAPELVLWHKKIGEWTGSEPVLAGSGATWFVEGAFESPSEKDRQGARWEVVTTTPPLQL